MEWMLNMGPSRRVSGIVVVVRSGVIALACGYTWVGGVSMLWYETRANSSVRQTQCAMIISMKASKQTIRTHQKSKPEEAPAPSSKRYSASKSKSRGSSP